MRERTVIEMLSHLKTNKQTNRGTLFFQQEITTALMESVKKENIEKMFVCCSVFYLENKVDNSCRCEPHLENVAHAADAKMRRERKKTGEKVPWSLGRG